MKSVNGWTIAHIHAIRQGGDTGETTEVTLESSDARLNGQTFPAINSLAMAQPNWTYALRFKQGVIIDDRILTER
jgi:hypothetical protein